MPAAGFTTRGTLEATAAALNLHLERSICKCFRVHGESTSMAAKAFRPQSASLEAAHHQQGSSQIYRLAANSLASQC